MKNKVQFHEIKRWLKRSLKKKISINNRTIIMYLMLGLVGVGNITFSAWTWKEAIWADGDHNKRMALLNSKNIAGDGSILLTDEIKKKDENGNPTSANISSLENSVIIGLGGATGSQKVDIQVEGGARGLVGIGNIGIYSNPHNTGRTGSGGQAVAIGDNVTSTSQSVAIGNETYAIGNASIAIGSDDIESYSKTSISNHVYDHYLKPLYNKIDNPDGSRYRRTYYSPNVAGGTGSISIGSRTLAFKDGATALGTLAFALGKSSTALGAESFA